MRTQTLAAFTLATLSLGAVSCDSVVGSVTSDGTAPIRISDQPSRAYTNAFNLPSHGVALEGYCPVAYHAVNKPVRGKPEHHSTHDNITYFFASADAKAAFDANPEVYVPAYGGWCAYGMSIQDKFPVDPENFKIVNGKLLLFLKNSGVDARSAWNRGNESKQLEKAAAHWSKVQG